MMSKEEHKPSQADETKAFITSCASNESKLNNSKTANDSGHEQIGENETNQIALKFRSVLSFTLCCGMCHFFFGMAASIMSAQIVAFERQFGLDSSFSGLLKTANSIGMLTTCMFSFHLARTVNIPKTVGLSGLITGISMTVPGFLHFIHPYHPEEKFMTTFNSQTNGTATFDKYTCIPITSNETSLDIEVKEGRGLFAYYVITICMAINGMMNPLMFGTLPMIFIDNNIVDKPKVGMYMAILTIATELVGPLGEIFNGFISNVPVNLRHNDLSTDDPRFVSAWWLGFLVFGGSTIASSIPLMFMPRNIIPRKEQMEALQWATESFTGVKVNLKDGQCKDDSENTENRTEVNYLKKESTCSLSLVVASGDRERRTTSVIESDNDAESNSNPRTIRKNNSSPTSTKIKNNGNHQTARVLLQKRRKRRTNLLRDIRVSMREFPISLRRVFTNPLWVILFIEITFLAVPWTGLSAYGIKYAIFEYHVTQSVANFARGLSISLTDIIGIVFSTLICTHLKTLRAYLYFISLTILLGTCLLPLQFVFRCDNNVILGKRGHLGSSIVNDNRSCNCKVTSTLLSCGTDSNTYLSPCHAGCAAKNASIYTDCAKLATHHYGDSVRPGVCDTGCFTKFIIYNVILSVQGFLYFLTHTPRRLLSIRITHPDDRAMADAFLVFFYSIVSIPAPFIIGKIFDSACRVWTGQCAYYDRHHLQNIFVGTDLVANIIAVLTYALMILVCKKQYSKPKEDKDELELG